MGMIVDGRSQKYVYNLGSFVGNDIDGGNGWSSPIIFVGNTSELMFRVLVLNATGVPIVFNKITQSDKSDMSDAVDLPIDKIVAPNGESGQAAIDQLKILAIPATQQKSIGVYATKRYIRFYLKGSGGVANVTGVIYAIGTKYYNPTVKPNQTGMELEL